MFDDIVRVRLPWQAFSLVLVVLFTYKVITTFYTRSNDPKQLAAVLVRDSTIYCILYVALNLSTELHEMFNGSL